MKHICLLLLLPFWMAQAETQPKTAKKGKPAVSKPPDIRSAVALKKWLHGTHWKGGRLSEKTWTFDGNDYVRVEDGKKFAFRTIDSKHFKVKWNSGLESTMELNDQFDAFHIRGQKGSFKRVEKGTDE